MATDERALLSPPNATGLRAARVGGARTKTARDDLHYYDDYGMTMSEEGYGLAKEKESEYKGKVIEAESALASGYSYLDQERNSAYGKLPKLPTWESWRDQNLREVRITDANGVNVEQSYWLPPNVIQEIAANEDFNTNYPFHIFEDGSMNIIPYIGGNPYGKELHEQLGEAQATIMNQFNTEISAASSEINEAKKAIDLSYNTGLEELNQQKGFLTSGVAQHQEYLSLMKKKYRERLADMKETIMTMFGGQ